MRYRRLGRWGLKVSEVTLGTWLTHGGAADGDTATTCTRRAYELGVNMFDTANIYPRGNEGAAERVLGAALSVFRRETYVVGTKVYAFMGDGPLERGLSRKHIMAQIDHSLRRLGMDHVDLYQCHRYDVETPLDETARTMNDLVVQGKILYWGVSQWSEEQLEQAVALCQANGWAPPVSNQPRYSALWRECEPRVLPACERLGMGVLAYSPLDHGVLTGKYQPGSSAPAGSRAATASHARLFDQFFDDDLLGAVQRFRELAEQAGYTAAQLALAWCLRQPTVSSVVVGASSLPQLEENAAAGVLDVEPELVDAATKILDPVRVT
ncbi:aldo/keto reductase family protein [Phytoactinopolyspora limicola]|uniref:aldo/keto reductase family protein n=1 Tax=Phytoactinopolyspora limicola TaxID=2715536 RepID=UPI00140B7A0C|nr:aldo/keto reductase family protein [Phytoactinopolyspora limicola]